MTRETSMVYVIDDDASVRTSVGRLLRVEGLEFTALPSAEEFLQLKSIKRPACAILDIQMPGLSGLELQDLLEKQGHHIPIIFVTGHGQVPESVRAMKKGAVDFLSKPYSSEALLQAIKQALEKDLLSIRLHRTRLVVQNRLDTLTEREHDVLRGVIAGLLNKQIAIRMKITEKTVKVHRASVIRKMKANSVPHLVRLAEMAGVTSSKN